MRKILVLSFLAAVVLSLGCAITDYPVITDTRGADAGAVMQSYYDQAYIKPSGDVALIYSDGSDNLFSEVSQTWMGDQWLYTYNNFDPTATLYFLDQTYCDPTRATNCAIATAWNPDLPTAYPHGDQSNAVDYPFDYIYNGSCSGARSLSILVSYVARIGECGSGIWADKQSLAYEFSILDKVNFRGHPFYNVPIDSSIASFSLKGADGATGNMPIYGRFNGYIDEQLRMVMPVTPNAKFQLRWMGNWINAHGHYLNMDMTYGSLKANFKLNVTTVQNALNRI